MAIKGQPNSTALQLTNVFLTAAPTELGVRIIFDPDADGGGGSTRFPNVKRKTIDSWVRRWSKAN